MATNAHMPFEGAVSLVKEYTPKKYKKYSCDCGMLELCGEFDPAWHLEECIIHKLHAKYNKKRKKKRR